MMNKGATHRFAFIVSDETGLPVESQLSSEAIVWAINQIPQYPERKGLTVTIERILTDTATVSVFGEDEPANDYSKLSSDAVVWAINQVPEFPGRKGLTVEIKDIYEDTGYEDEK